MADRLRFQGLIQTDRLTDADYYQQSDAIVAEIARDGMLTRVTSLRGECVCQLRYVAKGNHFRFPGFKIPVPLLAEWDPQTDTNARFAWETLQGADREKEQRRVINSFRRNVLKYPSELARIFKSEPVPEELRSTMSLLERLSKIESPEVFIDQLIVGLKQAARRREVPEQLTSALCGKTEILMFLEVDDFEAFSHRVADPRVDVAREKALERFESHRAADSGAQVTCSLTGRRAVSFGRTLPRPTLGPLGPTSLMSMNRDAPYLRKYGRCESDVFPCSRAAVQQIVAALKFMTSADRKGRTWLKVPNGRTKERPGRQRGKGQAARALPQAPKGDLLVAYLEDDPAGDAAVAALFGDPESTEELALSYEERTRGVIEALRGRAGRSSDFVSLVVLTTNEKALKQVVLGERYSTGRLLEARDAWIQGNRNIPVVELPRGAGREAPLRACDAVLSPVQFMIGFRRSWCRGGVECSLVPGVELREVMDLMLNREERLAETLLDRLVRLKKDLIIGLGGFVNRANVTDPISATRRNEELDAYRARLPEVVATLAAVGILLGTMCRVKESYMQDREYLVGQFLKLADEIQADYCTVVRDKRMPPMLIGNAALPLAMQSPVRALATVAPRLRIYQAWARTYAEPDDSGLAVPLVKWRLGNLAKVAEALARHDLEAPVTTAGKAEILLGYLARVKQDEGDQK